VPTTTELAAKLAALRGMIASLERGGSRQAPGRERLGFGLAALDTHLGGGLALGAVHELAAAGAEAEQGAAPALFAAGLLARHPGPVVWIQGARRDLYGVALAQAGLAPARLLVVQARRDALSAMEEALRHPHVAGVVCELDGSLDLAASRRLQLAAETSRVLGLVLRRGRRAAATPDVSGASAARAGAVRAEAAETEVARMVAAGMVAAGAEAAKGDPARISTPNVGAASVGASGPAASIGGDPAPVLPSAAWSRWRIASLPSPPPLAHAPEVAGLGRPLWRLELLRCRGAAPATWIVEACDAQGRLALAAVLADRPAAPAAPRRLAG